MSKSVDIFFPFYFGDYLKKTQMLSCLEHGAYFLLLSALWQEKGYIPMNEKKLSRICRLSVVEFKEVWEEIKCYFHQDGENVFNARVLIELGKAEERKRVASENGKRGGRPKLEKPSGLPSGVPGDKPGSKAKRNPQKSSSPSPSPSPLHSKSPSPSEDTKPKQKRFVAPSEDEIKKFGSEISFKHPGVDCSGEARRFFDYYESNGWRVGKNKMTKWQAAFRGWLSRSNSKAADNRPKQVDFNDNHYSENMRMYEDLDKRIKNGEDVFSNGQ